jgi:hypothetical protein
LISYYNIAIVILRDSFIHNNNIMLVGTILLPVYNTRLIIIVDE